MGNVPCTGTKLRKKGAIQMSIIISAVGLNNGIFYTPDCRFMHRAL
jgi:hypothetical protein